MKENFTENSKPFAKVLSNKKSRQRKKKAAQEKLLGRTACAPNSGALLFASIPCLTNKPSLRISTISFLLNKTPVWINNVSLRFIQILCLINQTSSLFDKISFPSNRIPLRINAAPLLHIRTLFPPRDEAGCDDKIALYFSRKQIYTENASSRNPARSNRCPVTENFTAGNRRKNLALSPSGG